MQGGRKLVDREEKIKSLILTLIPSRKEPHVYALKSSHFFLLCLSSPRSDERKIIIALLFFYFVL